MINDRMIVIKTLDDNILDIKHVIDDNASAYQNHDISLDIY